jgi:hypothetical protein
MEFLVMQSTAGTDAVKRLRQKKLQEGHPFMINSADLPVGVCYLEYPDGVIKLASLSSTRRDIDIIRDLDEAEVFNLRRKLNLY